MADSADNDLVKVCNFLRERGVQEGVVEKFEEEKGVPGSSGCVPGFNIHPIEHQKTRLKLSNLTILKEDGISAVLNANDDVLKDMGLSTAGDRLSLRGFCTTRLKRRNRTKKRNPKDEDFLRHSCLQRRKIGP
ncbi:hypothetical protein OS493_036275 [Desmophyllum pertusum]|uniref:Uncharacterized protein n=1 Tax=Desmophyllum pertusum TaxID=174260 RepID=A0A9X0D0I2_9CNID|nr:hypothetical protein OS493_036275 [Desmophyllum pertusum]